MLHILLHKISADLSLPSKQIIMQGKSLIFDIDPSKIIIS